MKSLLSVLLLAMAILAMCACDSDRIVTQKDLAEQQKAASNFSSRATEQSVNDVVNEACKAGFNLGVVYGELAHIDRPAKCRLLKQADAIANDYRTPALDISAIVDADPEVRAMRESCRKGAK